MPQPIMMVATTDIAEMMNPGEDRRMALPGFDPEFVDFPHYIIRITERIWHDRDVDLCLRYYAPDCRIHTLAGPIVGAATVVANTWATLAAFPDRRLDADNVIWSDEGDGAFLSSHLITSKMTNLGASEFGPPTGRAVLVRTIADCLCRANRVVEEWLVRDNLALVQQLGLDADRVAADQAAADAAAGRDLREVLAPDRAAAAAADDVQPVTAAGMTAVAALRAAWGGGDMASHYDFRVSGWVPGGEFIYGPDQLAAWQAGVRMAMPEVTLRIAHIADIPYLGDARDVAVRWTLTGEHRGGDRYGPATGAMLHILAVTHFRIIGGRVREEVTVWDDLAVRRQVAAARLAP